MLMMLALDMEAGPMLVIATVVLSITFVVFRLLLPIAQGFGKRLSGGAEPEPRVHGELEELRARVHELEEQQARLLELEERLDFTERMLTRGRAPEEQPRDLAR